MQIQPVKEPGFEEIAVARDPASGLHAIIAVHSTRLGPSLGGIRMHAYKREADALEDAKRLARAMTYKAAAAGLRLGGGKAVIFGDPRTQKTPALLEAMGKFVDTLAGRYISAKDAGIETEDLIAISKVTRHVTGLPEAMGGSGDPSPWTSRGLLEGMRTATQRRLGRKDFNGLTVLIQGIGHVGGGLAELLYKEKARLVCTDVEAQKLLHAESRWKARVIAPEALFSVDADVFAPCALGEVINEEAIPNLKFKVLAGGANNPLKHEALAESLMRRGILFAPDYVVNAGGLINIYAREVLKGQDPMRWIGQIPAHLKRIFDLSEAKKITPLRAAAQMAEEILAQGPSALPS